MNMEPSSIEEFASRIDQVIFPFYISQLSGMESLLKFIDNHKETFKELIRRKTGKVIRRTPKRGNRFKTLETRINSCKMFVFANEETGNQTPVWSPTNMATPQKRNRICKAPVVQKKDNEKSQLLQHLEEKQKAVISNREKIIRNKAERARRDREIRMQRVLLNNEKKARERERLAEAICRKKDSTNTMKAKNGINHTRLLKNVENRLPLIDVQSKSLAVNEKKGFIKNSILRNSGVTVEHERKLQLSPRTVFEEKPSSMEWDPKCDSGIHLAKTEKDVTSIGSKNAFNYFGRNILHTVIGKYTSLTINSNLDNKGFGSVDYEVLKTKKANVYYKKKNGTNTTSESGNNSMSSSELRDQLLDNEMSLSKYTSTLGLVSDVGQQSVKGTEISRENYDIASLCSSNETDDEDNPRKKIPNWAKPVNLQKALKAQYLHPPKDLEKFFGKIEAPNLTRIFSSYRKRYYKRTSSARWSSPLTNPREGFSLYFALQNQ